MRFETSPGSCHAVGAAYAWHEAFNSGVGSIDMREVLNEFGVQFSAKGGDNKILDHCDKGKIQQAVFSVKQENITAWAWGMWAYAPLGAENGNTLINILFKFAMCSVQTEKLNPFMDVSCGKLARIAIEDAAIEARTKVRYRRRRSDMGTALCCDAETYQKKWMPIFFKMKDALHDLDAIALPPVANLIWTLVDKANGDTEASEDLRRAMRTPREAA